MSTNNLTIFNQSMDWLDDRASRLSRQAFQWLRPLVDRVNSNTTLAAVLGGIAGLSVVGNPTNAAEDAEAITASADGQVLRRNGTALGFGTIATAGIADAAVSMAKLADLAGLSIVGRGANSTGVPAAITGADGNVLRVSGTTLGFGAIATAGIADNAVTLAKLGSDATAQATTSTDGFMSAADKQKLDWLDVTADHTITGDLDVTGAVVAKQSANAAANPGFSFTSRPDVGVGFDNNQGLPFLGYVNTVCLYWCTSFISLNIDPVLLRNGAQLVNSDALPSLLQFKQSGALMRIAASTVQARLNEPPIYKTTDYTMTATDSIVVMVSPSSSRTVTLPQIANMTEGDQIQIKDGGGAAATKNITIDANASELIDGALTKTISTNWGTVRLQAVTISSVAQWITL